MFPVYSPFSREMTLRSLPVLQPRHQSARSSLPRTHPGQLPILQARERKQDRDRETDTVSGNGRNEAVESQEAEVQATNAEEAEALQS
jgi:hypothetical protein